MEKKLHFIANRRSVAMKNLFMFGLVLVSAGPLLSQTKIGGSGAPDNSAMLEVTGGTGNNKGILPPRLTTTQRDAITSPATGLMIYNTTSNQLQVNIGTPAAPVWTVPTVDNAWKLTGNAGINPAINFIGTTDAQPLIARTNNLERLRLTPTGAMGIGTSSPGGKLHIFSNTPENGLAIDAMAVGGSSIPLWIRTQTTSNNSGVTMRISSNQTGNTGTLDVGILNGAASLQSINIGNTPGNIALNSTGGNVGIGTTAPAQKLDVVGTARISGSAGTATAVVGRNAAGDISNLTLGSGLSIAGGTLNTTAAAGWALAGNAGTNPATQFVGTTDAQPLIFRTGNTEKLRIATNGNVGINDGTPLAPLSFASVIGPKIRFYDDGTDNATYGIGISAASLNYHIENSAVAAHRFHAGGSNGDGTELIRIQGNGNVGIGNGTPLSPLSFANTTTPKISLYDGGSATEHYGFGISGGQFNYHAMGGASHVFYNGGKNGDGTELMRIHGNGNVGIGTAAPAAKLDVNGTARISGNAGTATGVVGRNAAGDISNITLGSNLSLSGGVLNATVPATTGWSLTGNTGTNPATQFVGTTDAQPLVLRTNAIERMRFTVTGNVGIGTGAPNSLLDLGPGVGTSATDATGKKLAIYNDVAGTDFYGFGVSSGVLQFHASSAPTDAPGMVLDAADNVGIGTITPAAKLDVNGTARIAGSVGTPAAIMGRDAGGNVGNITLGANLSLAGGVLSASGGGTAGWGLTGNAGTNPATNFIGTTDAQPLKFRTSNIEWATLTDNGFLGLNTTAPTARLTVSSSSEATSDDIAIRRYANVSGVPRFTMVTASGTEAAPGNIFNGQVLGTINWIGRVNGTNHTLNSIRSLYTGNGTNFSSEFRFNTSDQFAVVIDENQNMGIGVANPTQRLEVNGNVLASNVMVPSDSRLKKDITDMPQGLNDILKLRPVSYKMKKDETGVTQFGFLAQELEKIMPEVVNKPKSQDQFYSVNYMELIPVLTKAIQEQQAQIDALKAENQKLKVSSTVTAELMERVKKMEQMLAIKANERSSHVAAK